MKGKILFQGAESVITRNGNYVLKNRQKKTYRISEIDEKIRKLRTRGEAKILEKASKVVNVPKVLKSSEKTKEIVMDFVNGQKLSEGLNNFELKKQKEIAQKIGKDVGKLHDVNLIHGDLTTSNLILKNDEIYFIDFGLGFHSTKIEDRAVDLYLLKQALEAKHFENFKILFREILKNYKSENREKVLKQLEKVEKRRRYK